jgi:fructokinase
MNQLQKRVWVVGEALMDLIPDAGGQRQPMVGGGPANTAKAIARLGYSTYFVGGISTDGYGRMIEAELRDSGVDLSLVVRRDLPTALAIASIDDNGLARYEFELEGSASFAFDQSWLPHGEPDVIHIGSVATLLEPGASELLHWLSEKSAPIVFDPNVRPSIQGDQGLYRAAVERWLDYATVVKMSEDDFRWLYSESEEELVRSWIGRGVSIVIVTRAEKGLSAYSADFELSVDAVSVEVMDTVGAGDTIGAVVVEGLLQYGLPGLNMQTLSIVLSRAAKAASITCSRAGANPPWLEELDRI